MNLSSQSYTVVKSSIEEALGKYVADGNRTMITDIHLQPKQDSGELVILNDDDEVLSQVTVQEWVNYDGERFYDLVESVLRKILMNIQDSKALENLCLMKPFSFVMIDEEKETVAELLLVDDSETMFLSDELLKGLDEELDAFLKELLEK